MAFSRPRKAEVLLVRALTPSNPRWQQVGVSGRGTTGSPSRPCARAVAVSWRFPQGLRHRPVQDSPHRGKASVPRAADQRLHVHLAEQAARPGHTRLSLTRAARASVPAVRCARALKRLAGSLRPRRPARDTAVSPALPYPEVVQQHAVTVPIGGGHSRRLRSPIRAAGPVDGAAISRSLSLRGNHSDCNLCTCTELYRGDVAGSL